MIAQQLESRIAILRRCSGEIALLAQLGPCTVLSGDGVEQLAIVAALIEQLALRSALHQRLVFHLAVNIDERFAQLAQRLHRHRLAVDVSARAPIRADDPAQHAFVLVLDRLLGEPGARRRIVRDGERGGDFGALGAVPDDLCTRAAAGGEQQRVHENGFTGAGFAGQDRQAGGELQFGSVDDREVANLDMQQHGGCQSCDCAGGTRSPRPQRSFERRIRK